MLFAIKLGYVRPIEEVQTYLDAHKGWLVRYVQTGNILVAGPLQHGKGGVVLAYADHLRDIEAMIAEDPFHVHGLATFDIQCCDAGIRAADFPEKWATAAKAI
ncbi:YCII-related domain protein [Burkholderia multivorans]|uniref:YciI family protein n=1 Tax=Burkholderia multivorans TaxID=87883 RepID=UPI00050E9501|nr:YciI family protein [Burkholderia multivorans]KGB89650.1 YCII-related domain protein [Burkholderia multivorans]